jgi:hypothetical protein
MTDYPEHEEKIPLHETEQDRENEARIINHAAKLLGLIPIYTPVAYPIDAVLTKNRRDVVAFAEARVRKNALKHFPTFDWSLQKYISAMRYALVLPTLLFVKFNDGIFWTRIGDIEHKRVTWMERKKTARSKKDNEPMINIPIKHFFPLHYENN